MKFRWIVLILFLSILTFQSKNILTFVGVELGVYFGFKELDKNSSGFIEREEWSEGMFSLLDFDRDNLASKEEFREFIKEFSKEFSWENELNDKYIYPRQLKKGSFQSTLMNTSIGYYIYIPDAYQEKPEKRFRTVYYLHGGRPGNEAREAFISHYVHEVFKNPSIDPAIYIFVNGGELSHYNSDELNSYGEDVFIKELIPHIDKVYRTIAKRQGRGLEGFSQGGRAATRYMFKYPDLFGTVSAGGGSYTIEKLIKESQGFEDDPRDDKETIYYVGMGNDAWSLAEQHKSSQNVTPKLMLWSGTEDMNYKSVEEYQSFLEKLKIEHKLLSIEGVDHNSSVFYEKAGTSLVKFHIGESDNAN
jgi:endo-1,4-beta-xylanase